MRTATTDLYNSYCDQMRKIADVRYSLAVLQWDQETYLPPLGADIRGRQIATLTEIAHEMFTSHSFGDLLSNLVERTELTPEERRNVELSLEDYTKSKKFTPEFVRARSEAISASFHHWLLARKENSYAVFKPYLEEVIRFKREEAELLGYEKHPYDALMDEYEKGSTVDLADKIFADVQGPLRALLNEVQQRPEADDSFMQQHFPKDEQWAWGQYLATQLGFSFGAGRQDIAEHPFCTNFNNRDVRITTRISENDFYNMTWSTIHEVGHALYEQGLPSIQYGLPLGEYTSLSIHESQSRLWENNVARGLPFWTWYYPILQHRFPAQFANVGILQFINAVNKVKPSLVRTEADELTYHFHVMIRYELEKQLIAGSLNAADVPGFWNEQYEKLLGLKVPDDRQGALQDVHWSHGSFGYFATYSLGSFYAAQFWQQVNDDIPALTNELSTTGSSALLLDWLRTRIHVHGRRYTSEELCKMVTGKGLDSTVFVDYLRSKLRS
ncbi:carboxypeptidase M32 [Segetibacter sp. 3557_3]|nr:carboxypeptidase M32 [Segetibacter sp. 3557_3]